MAYVGLFVISDRHSGWNFENEYQKKFMIVWWPINKQQLNAAAVKDWKIIPRDEIQYIVMPIGLQTAGLRS